MTARAVILRAIGAPENGKKDVHRTGEDPAGEVQAA